MAGKKGRKQVAAWIKDESHADLEQFKEETGLSVAKLIEMLLEHYKNTKHQTPNQPQLTEARVAEMIQEALSKALGTKEETKPTPSLAPKPEIDPEMRKKLIRSGDWIEDDDDEYELSEEDKRRIAEFEEEEAIRQAEEQKYWDQQDLDSTPTPEPIKPPSSEDLELMELIRQHEQEWMD